jgi:hypothetical protein
MDLTLSTDQKDLEDGLKSLFERSAGAARARAVGDGLDRDLLDVLERQGFLDIATESSLVDAVLLVEQAERAHARAPIAARTIVAPLVGKAGPGLAIGLVSGREALVRHAGQCDQYLFLDGDAASSADAAQVEVEPVASRWGYPLGRVRALAREPLADARALRSAWQLSLAAEMGAQMQVAVALTARYVTERHQFGRAIGSYQAVSHRLATAAVHAEGTTWMARRAAWNITDPALVAAAATYACESARVVNDACHQVTGAIGITREYDLVQSTMRLGFLATELGGLPYHAAVVARERWLS